MSKALIKNILLIFVISGLPISAVAECVVTKDSEGQSIHICDNDKADSHEVSRGVADSHMELRERASEPYEEGDDAYMMDFADDTVRENMDSGADDNP